MDVLRSLKLAFLLRHAAVWAWALALAGCFHPLYGTSINGGSGVQQELQAIAVDPIPDRIGHYLANELIFGLNGSGDQMPPKYHLLVTTSESTQTAVIDQVTQEASAATLVCVANYRLVPAGGGEPVATGQVTSSTAYNRFQERYANIQAARSAEVRNAHTLADLIKTRLAAVFAAKL